jgi:CMP-N-acetylneuraminic acid synthetase
MITPTQPKVLAIIPARGGSKAVPQKNLRSLGGRPLIEWTIEAAREAECVTHVIVSTDSPQIAEVARAVGADVPFLRPAELATDTASSLDVVAHAIHACPGYDVALLLQPTSPLRRSADIDAAFSLMRDRNAESCASVAPVEESPWLMFCLGDNGRMEPVLSPWPGGMRRQDLPPVYTLNGAIYFVMTAAFARTGQLITTQTVAYEMDRDRSIDIDTHADFERAEAIFRATRAQ